MKRLTILIVIFLMLVSCGTRSGHFKLEGRFMHLNEGELYVYSPDGAIQGFDTIKVETGRFAYEIPCTQQGTLVLVFPNYSEHPIFTQPGKTADVKADASHLKEMKVTGTKDNELMTQFREMTSLASPPEEARLAAQFIRDHADSHVAVYLLRKYYLRAAKANMAEGCNLAATLLKAQPDNGILANLKKAIEQRAASAAGNRLPAFTATGTDGNKITATELQKADRAVILVWGSWSFQSLDMLRQLRTASEKDPQLKVVTINVDARKNDCTNQLESNNIDFPTVWDGNLLDMPLLQKLGLSTVPANLVLEKGKIAKHNLNNADLRRWLDDHAK